MKRELIIIAYKLCVKGISARSTHKQMEQLSSMYNFSKNE